MSNLQTAPVAAYIAKLEQRLLDFEGRTFSENEEIKKLKQENAELKEKLALFDEAVELLKESYGYVRTYAMQTYSKLSARNANEIETFLKKLGE